MLAILTLVATIVGVLYTYRDYKLNKNVSMLTLSETKKTGLEKKKKLHLKFLSSHIYLLLLIPNILWISSNYSKSDLTVKDIILISLMVSATLIFLNAYIKILIQYIVKLKGIKSVNHNTSKDDTIQELLNSTKELKELLESIKNKNVD